MAGPRTKNPHNQGSWVETSGTFPLSEGMSPLGSYDLLRLNPEFPDSHLTDWARVAAVFGPFCLLKSCKRKRTKHGVNNYVHIYIYIYIYIHIYGVWHGKEKGGIGTRTSKPGDLRQQHYRECRRGRCEWRL